MSETLYTTDWYDGITSGSEKSARVVLPLVLAALRPASVLDVGCGTGPWLAVARELGVEDVLGVDGDHVDPERVRIPAERFLTANLEEPLDLGRRFDLALSLEVAEHLSPRGGEELVRTLVRHADAILFSAAIPAQGGQHHVNEQWPEYWAAAFAREGYVAVDHLRPRVWRHPDVEAWYAQNLMLYVARHRLDELPGLAGDVPPDGLPLSVVHPWAFEGDRRWTATGCENPFTQAPAPLLGAPEPNVVVAAYADEVAADLGLLTGYRDAVAAHPGTSLVLYAPDRDEDEGYALVAPALAAARLDTEEGPEILLLCVPSEQGDGALAAQADAVLTRFPPGVVLGSLPHVGPEALAGHLSAAAATASPAVSPPPVPQAPSAFGRTLLRTVLERAAAPDVPDNVDAVRFPDGQTPVAPAEAAERLEGLLADAPGLERLWARLDARSADLMVDVLAYRVLGHTKVRLPLGPGCRVERRVDDLRHRCLVEAGTARLEFLGWELDLYDLAPLGLPVRLHSHASLLLANFVLDQYRHPGPPEIGVRLGDVVVDGGGCWGETSLGFAHAAGQDGLVVCCEFDPDNLALLERNLALNPALAARVDVLRAPLWSRAGEEVRYRAFGPGSSLGGDGDTVTTASIDDLVASGRVPRVDFVKLDIEGAERDALLGARETLRRFRPRLAIAAYHRPDDLIQLPEVIDGLGLGYRYALGHFTAHAEETVLFAWCEA